MYALFSVSRITESGNSFGGLRCARAPNGWSGLRLRFVTSPFVIRIGFASYENYIMKIFRVMRDSVTIVYIKRFVC